MYFFIPTYPRSLEYAAAMEVNPEHSGTATPKKGCGTTTSTNALSNPVKVNKMSGSLYEHLKNCPLHCLPLSQEVSGIDNKSSDKKRNSDNNIGSDPRDSYSWQYRPPMPVVLRAPDSKVILCPIDMRCVSLIFFP